MAISIRTASGGQTSGNALGGCIAIVGLPFAIAGVAIGLFLYLPVLTTWWNARSWVETPCRIETAKLKVNPGRQSSRSGGRKSPTYEVQASYRYEFDGQSYRSNRVSLGKGADNIGSFHQRAHEELEAYRRSREPFVCYVDPHRPEESILYRDLRWGLLLLYSVFPTVFPLVGGGMVIGGVLGQRQALASAALRKRHPGEPWRWRPEWKGDEVLPVKDHMALIFAAAAWIGLVQLPLAGALIASGEIERTPVAAFALLPSLLLLVPVAMAIGRLKTRRRLGDVSLLLNETPLRPGRALEGVLRFGASLSLRESLKLRMSCTKTTVHRSGGKNRTVTETLWENAETLGTGPARRDSRGTVLPLRLDLPGDLPGTSPDPSPSETRTWSLEIASASGGKPVRIALPVFKT